MHKRQLLSLLLTTLITLASAQHSFVVQNGSTSTHQSFTEAYLSAHNGDTIYLPGGEISTPAIIDKSLVWIGVGHQPDSTSATYFTAIINALTFTGNCDNSYLTGLYFRQAISLGDTEDDATNFTIERCRLDRGLTIKRSKEKANIDFKMSECYSGGTINAGYASNCIIEKSVISGIVTKFHQSYFDRNIHLYGKSVSYGPKYCMQGDTNCFITNSIFIKYHTTILDSENNTFSNNIFAESIVLPQGSNTGIKNIIGAGTSLFENVPNSTVFSYENNYRLKVDSPGKGAATDGTDIGLFGGADPLKEGYLPFNPHVQTVIIDLKTTNGLLPVNVKVAAQNE